MNQTSSATSSETSSKNKGSTVRITVTIAVILLLLLGGFYYWLNRDQALATDTSPPPIVRLDAAPVAAPLPSTPPETFDPVITSDTAETVPQRPIIPPPANLENSDKQVKLAIADLSPDMLDWVVSDQLLRKWVLAIDLMADGDVLKQYRPLSVPMAHFEPQVRGVEPGAQYFMKPESFSRTDLVVKLFTSMDVDAVAEYYRFWLPILEKTYQEQGKKDSFDQRFRAALQRVMDVKPLNIMPALAKRGGVIFVYADSQLESATDVEKMMWRLGPDNSAKVQAYIKQLQAALPAVKK